MCCKATRCRYLKGPWNRTRARGRLALQAEALVSRCGRRKVTARPGGHGRAAYSPPGFRFCTGRNAHVARAAGEWCQTEPAAAPARNGHTAAAHHAHSTHRGQGQAVPHHTPRGAPAFAPRVPPPPRGSRVPRGSAAGPAAVAQKAPMSTGPPVLLGGPRACTHFCPQIRMLRLDGLS